jgi:hypothetical protein
LCSPLELLPADLAALAARINIPSIMKDGEQVVAEFRNGTYKKTCKGRATVSLDFPKEFTLRMPVIDLQ